MTIDECARNRSTLRLSRFRRSSDDGTRSSGQTSFGFLDLPCERAQATASDETGARAAGVRGIRAV
jgi:hypothetical protein